MNIIGMSLKIGRKLRLVPVLPKIIRGLNRIIFSCDVPVETEIHEDVLFPHNGLGVVINVNSVIGSGTKILHNVTIGGNGSTRFYKGKYIVAPIIGKNVLIGAGSILIGPIIIGDNSIIGAGSVVTSDVPYESKVYGVAARIRK